MMQDQKFRSRCISIDLEVRKKDSRIQAIGAIRADTGQRYTHSGRVARRELAVLDKLADGAEFVIGHNITEFDLRHLQAAKPDLRLLQLPVVDTLRLSPLAFPRNPYHGLIKHYKDAGLIRAQINDPELDAGLVLQVFEEQYAALSNASSSLLIAWHWLTTPNFRSVDSALDQLFVGLHQSPRPSDEQAHVAIMDRFERTTCATEGKKILLRSREYGWSLAYALAWFSVAGGNSVMPPWVRHQFPEAGQLVRRLRDKSCSDPACNWCREHHDAKKELKRWFGFSEFRPEPRHIDERPMQQAIVEEAMTGNHALGILPTGTGKSLCYQIPALSRYNKTGALTVVISPLVALMADQVAGLEAHGISSCVAINGLLSMPERSEALDRVRLGDIGVLLIAPEQLRSRSVRRVLDQREIGAWVLDEAHCLSRWGHDFRPDYRYIGRFIGEKAGKESVPPVLCLTATANLNVIDDIVWHFEDKLNIKLKVFNGGSERTNLVYETVPTTEAEKFNLIHELLESNLPHSQPGGAIVYCATRRLTEEVAEYLRHKDIAADHFHAGLQPENKKDVQQRFIKGELRAIVATNAFGMGIDKPDVRLVIHADIPGSLENYFQEAGRAGRDGEIARCVLLYDSEDVERQFGMSARSRLSRAEIAAVLRALRNLNRKKRQKGEVIATAGEILVEDEDQAFQRDSATDDNRVRTAITWLEESELLTREENVVNVFPSSLRVNTIDEAKERLDRAKINKTYRDQLLLIAKELINADADEGITTDELVAVTGLNAEGVRNALYTLEQIGIASNDTVLTAYVHAGVARSSKKRLQEANQLESELIAYMRETAPDMGVGESSIFHLRAASQELRNRGLVDPLPARILRILRSISSDGRGEDDGVSGSISLRSRDAETVIVTLRREWEKLDQIARKRREAAECLLTHLLEQLPSGSQGLSLLAETTIGQLLHVIKSDLVLMRNVTRPEKLLDRALLWLHEQEVIILNKGLVVFRPAMLVRLDQDQRKRGFSNADFKPLADHYKGKVFQIHVMVEFAKQGLEKIANAKRLAREYFELKSDDFFTRWFSDRDSEIGRETTPESWRSIVEILKNPVQQRIVADPREQTNVLVLAGPGSGKTRVLVHRIAYLVRAKRENPRGILALVYNRHAAVEIRRRLKELIGDDSRGVTVLTCHALAMRLVGVTFDGKERVADDNWFQEVLRDAVRLLRGEGLSSQVEAVEQRERLLTGFRWILVDEYQDVGSDECELISALAGRTLDNESRKLTLFAVGDDDQNIYAFKGASVKFIRRFESDYGPNSVYLTANYRSTFHIIEAANKVIAPARERMKVGNPIQINRARRKEPHGGEWQTLDPVSKGRVQILPVGNNSVSQAQTVMLELQRLTNLASAEWSKCAVIAREWDYLHAVRAVCEDQKIPVQMGDEDEHIPRFFRLRETQQFIGWVRGLKSSVVTTELMRGWLGRQSMNRWFGLIQQCIDEFDLETGGVEMPVKQFVEWLAEWGQEIRRRPHGLLLLTAHRAKGLEFDHVAVLDGGWKRVGNNEDTDASRRLYYVSMTRAKQTLILAKSKSSHPFLRELNDNTSVLLRNRIDIPEESADFHKRYINPDLSKLNLGFAGRRNSRHHIHCAIADLSPGDPLDVRIDEGRGKWDLLDREGVPVGRLADKFEPPKGMRCKSAEVSAVVKWSKELSDQKYHDSMKCDSWEVVVPRFVFEPDGKPVPRQIK